MKLTESPRAQGRGEVSLERWSDLSRPLRARLPGPRARLYALRHLIEHGEFHPGCRPIVKRTLLVAGLITAAGKPTDLGRRTIEVADSRKGRKRGKPGRPLGHVPRNKGQASIGHRLPPRSASLTLRQLFARMDEDRRSAAEIATRIGITPVALSNWRSGRTSPDILSVEAFAEVLNCRLIVQNDN